MPNKNKVMSSSSSDEYSMNESSVDNESDNESSKTSSALSFKSEKSRRISITSSDMDSDIDMNSTEEKRTDINESSNHSLSLNKSRNFSIDSHTETEFNDDVAQNFKSLTIEQFKNLAKEQKKNPEHSNNKFYQSRNSISSNSFIDEKEIHSKNLNIPVQNNLFQDSQKQISQDVQVEKETTNYLNSKASELTKKKQNNKSKKRKHDEISEITNKSKKRKIDKIIKKKNEKKISLNNTTRKDNSVIDDLKEKYPNTFRITLDNVSKETIEKILNETLEGQFLLIKNANKEKLDSTEKQTLCDLISNRIDCNNIGTSSPNFFRKLVDKLVQLFPLENKNIYFIQPHCEINDSKNAKGKFPDKWRNWNHLLKNHNIDSTKRVSISSEQIVNVSEEVEVSKKWLQSNRQPIVNLLEHWKITRAYRMSVFRTESYEKIFNDWPILNSDLAMRLISNDFHSLYPGKSIEFDQNFQKIFNKLYEINKKNIKDEKGKIYMKFYEKFLEKNYDVSTVMILLIPYLMNACPMIKTPSGMKKPTLQESSEGLVLHVKDVEEVEEAIENRRKRYALWKLTEQPCFIIVAEKLNKVDSCYVNFNNKLWQVQSPLEGLRTTFMIIMIINTQYPADSNHIWTFIQRNIFNIKTNYDKISQGLIQIEDLL